METKHTLEELKQYQSLSLESKIHMTATRINGWIREYGEDGVYVSFSGGKDSTVLMDIVRNEMGYNLPAAFVDVPTQFPELKEFATSWDNVEVLKPKISFMDVCKKYGFPLISKEVSSAIYDARNYLTRVIEMTESVQTDRQTDRQNSRLLGICRYNRHTEKASCKSRGTISESQAGDYP